VDECKPLELGCPMDGRAVALAAKGGHLAVLQWVREQGCRWDGKEDGDEHHAITSYYAARAGHLEVLRWLREKDCPWDWRVIAFAARPEISQWAQANGCPNFDPEFDDDEFDEYWDPYEYGID
jgi:hypothetical protein